MYRYSILNITGVHGAYLILHPKDHTRSRCEPWVNTTKQLCSYGGSIVHAYQPEQIACYDIHLAGPHSSGQHTDHYSMSREEKSLPPCIMAGAYSLWRFVPEALQGQWAGGSVVWHRETLLTRYPATEHLGLLEVTAA